MLEVKPICCQLPTSHRNISNFNRAFPLCLTSNFPKTSISSVRHNNITRSVNNHLGSRSIDIVGHHRLKYPDVPKSSRILNNNRSIFSLKESSKPTELIFKGNSTEYIQSEVKTNKELIRYIRHIGCQTDYREESTQTDPFSPIYTISSGEHPEVFALSDFTYGKGLPATSVEISFIERLRARREWEQDHTIDMTRTRIVIEREIREWQLRETEIKTLQDIREKLFTKNLHSYIEIDESVTQNIIDLSVYRLEKQLKIKHKRIEIDTSRDIRRIKRMYRLREAQINAVTSYNHLGVIGMIKRENGCISSLKPPWHSRPDDIITTFKNLTSKISTSCSHFDSLLDRRMNQSQINIFQLEQMLPKNALITQIDELDSLKILPNNKKLYRRIQDLEKANQLTQEEKTKQISTSEKKSLRFLEKIETIDHIKQLPTTPIETEAHNQRRIAIIRLQNYLRSVIVQSRILNVHHIRRDLLDELRNGLKYNQISSSDNSNHNYKNQFVSPRTQIYNYLESTTIADMLDFLSKELIRLQSEQTIHLFILLADRSRYQREAAESGTRAKSIEQQKFEERVFQEMFSLNSNCDIDSYLQDLILQSISNTADEQTKLEIKQITGTLISLTDQIDNCSSNQSNIEMLVSDLVHNFLFPTVQRILTQQTHQKSSQTKINLN